MGNKTELGDVNWARIEELVKFQGITWDWLAERTRMSSSKLRALRRGEPHNNLHDWQLQLMAEALGVPTNHLLADAGVTP